MNIVKKLIQYNFTPNANKPEYIVIHDTGNRSLGANAEMHYIYFNGGDRQASAHFFVDDKQIIQTIEVKDKAWHVGDGRNQFGINNSNSIGVEICVNADGNYDIALENTLDLVEYLMKTYNIDTSKVVTHNSASKKNCPASMNKDGAWTGWIEFKNKLSNGLNREAYIMFKDENEISDYAKESVKHIFDLGIMKGDSDGNFYPTKPITRQDLAVVVDNLLKLSKKDLEVIVNDLVKMLDK